jgi:hypothetical protein
MPGVTTLRVKQYGESIKNREYFFELEARFEKPLGTEEVA